MQSKFKRILFGGDYNPNQWPKEVWAQDMAYFKDAHINSATINVFSWAKIQPSENEYNFTELDEIVDMLSNENYDIVMATSTAALPAWMVKKYPETMSTDYEGRQHKFGARHNFCPNSLVYQKYAKALATELAKRYSGNKIFLYGTSITSTADTVTVTTVRSSFVYGSRISTRLLMP